MKSKDRRRPDKGAGGNVRASQGCGSRYREQYGVIVVCQGERDQQQIYQRFRREGYNCRVVVT